MNFSDFIGLDSNDLVRILTEKVLNSHVVLFIFLLLNVISNQSNFRKKHLFVWEVKHIVHHWEGMALGDCGTWSHCICRKEACKEGLMLVLSFQLCFCPVQESIPWNCAACFIMDSLSLSIINLIKLEIITHVCSEIYLWDDYGICYVDNDN